MTARAQSHELDLFRSLGAVGVIAKPFDPMTLATSVRAQIGPTDFLLGAMRQRFLQRFDDDLVALAQRWSAVEDGSAVASSLAEIRNIAHGLAGPVEFSASMKSASLPRPLKRQSFSSAAAWAP